MKMTTLFFSTILATFFLFNSLAGATDLNVLPKWVWISAGGTNTNQLLSPSNQINNWNLFTGNLGGEVELGHTFFAVTIGAQGSLSSGNMKYDFTDPVGLHYVVNNNGFAFSTSEVYLGFKVKFINQPGLHFYGEGGGSMGMMYTSYDASAAVKAIGNTYKTAENNIGLYGYYGEVGLDIKPWTWGFRISGRYEVHTAGALQAMNRQTLLYQGTSLCFGIVKDFAAK